MGLCLGRAETLKKVMGRAGPGRKKMKIACDGPGRGQSCTKLIGRASALEMGALYGPLHPAL